MRLCVCVSLFQRIVAFSILCELYRSEVNGTNPFLPFFLEALEVGTDLCEKHFLKELLTSNTSYRDSVRKSAKVLIRDFEVRITPSMPHRAPP